MAVPSLSCLHVLRRLASQRQPAQCLHAIRFSSTQQTPLREVSKSASAASKKAPLLQEPSRDQRKAGPQPLTHPLGVQDPPQAGENWGIDARSLRQRRDDFVSHDKHLERRSRLAKTLFRPYFKDFNDMRFYKGKVFFAPERLFKAHFAQYFPNLRGLTLQGEEADTTPTLQGKVSVVALSSSGWAEKQSKSFISEKENSALQALLDLDGSGGNGRARLMEINYEPNAFKYWIVKLFQSGLRAARDKSRWGDYFVVRKGFHRDLRLSIGMSNEKVGHVYLVDPACRIRWAGHGEAEASEKASMVTCLQRLLNEAKEGPRFVTAQPRSPLQEPGISPKA